MKDGGKLMKLKTVLPKTIPQYFCAEMRDKSNFSYQPLSHPSPTPLRELETLSCDVMWHCGIFQDGADTGWQRSG